MKDKNKKVITTILFVLAIGSLSAQNEWLLSGNNVTGGQPILGTLYNQQSPQPLRFYANGIQRGIFSQYSGYLGVGTNAPKNPLHIHSNDIRGNYFDFNYDDPENPIIGSDVNVVTRMDSLIPRDSSINRPSGDYSGLQITNAATGANPDNGLLMYVHGRHGFLRHQESDLFTIGSRDFDIMNFTLDGRVGIGTDQPAQMLHVVNGNILISRTSNMSNRAPGSYNNMLKMSGVLAHCKGIVLGGFTDCKNDVGYESVEAMLREYIVPYNIPLLCGFPAGHEKLNLPIVIGATVTMEVRADGATLIFDIPGDNIIIENK